jgi:hypothetical protein
VSRRSDPLSLVVSTVIDGQTILLNLRTGTYLALTGSGGELWRLSREHGMERAIDIAGAGYGLPPERIRADLHELIRQIATSRAKRVGPRSRAFRIPSARQLRAVPLGAWPTLIATAAVAGAFEVGMRLLSLPRLARLAGMRLGTQPRRASDAHDAVTEALTPQQRRRVWATERVYAAWPFGDTCLRRALVLGHHLRDQNPLLRIGVTAGSGARGGACADQCEPIAAHAWVETTNVTLLALPGYETLSVDPWSPTPAPP